MSKPKMTKEDALRKLRKAVHRKVETIAYLSFCRCPIKIVGMCMHCAALSRIRAGEETREVVEDYL